MRTIGLIAEGYTDQVVLSHVLRGWFADEDEPEINPVQPQDTDLQAHGTYAPGGWTVLFDFLRGGGHREALQFNELLVIHVDTDVAGEKGFDVPYDADPEKMAEAVEGRLRRVMSEEAGDPTFFSEHGGRIVFAVAVDEIECWLLPLCFPDKAAKAKKVTGCLEAMNTELRRVGAAPLTRGEGKDPVAYAVASKPYSERRVLVKEAKRNPSLQRFVDALTAWGDAT